MSEINSPKIELLVDLENGWGDGADLWKQFKEASMAIDSIGISERRSALDARTAGLEPAHLVRLIREFANSTPLSVELGSNLDLTGSPERLRTIDERA